MPAGISLDIQYEINPDMDMMSTQHLSSDVEKETRKEKVKKDRENENMQKGKERRKKEKEGKKAKKENLKKEERETRIRKCQKKERKKKRKKNPKEIKGIEKKYIHKTYSFPHNFHIQIHNIQPLNPTRNPPIHKHFPPPPYSQR